VLDGSGALSKEQSLRTETIKGSLEPAWREGAASFELPASFAGLHVVLFDWNSAGGHALLGEVVLSAQAALEMATAREDRRAADADGHWLELEQPPGSAQGASGAVRLRLRASALAEPLRRQLLASACARAARYELPAELAKQLKAQRAAPSSSILGTNAAATWTAAAGPRAAEPPYATLHVELVEARGLAAADSNGLSDPYARIFCAGATWQSAVVRQTLEPRWGERRAFALRRADASAGVLHLVLFDRDRQMLGADDYLGELLLPVGALARHGAADLWFELGSARAAASVKGAVRLRTSLELADQPPRPPSPPMHTPPRSSTALSAELGASGRRSSGGGGGAADVSDDAPLLTAEGLSEAARVRAARRARHRAPRKRGGRARAPRLRAPHLSLLVARSAVFCLARARARRPKPSRTASRARRPTRACWAAGARAWRSSSSRRRCRPRSAGCSCRCASSRRASWPRATCSTRPTRTRSRTSATPTCARPCSGARSHPSGAPRACSTSRSKARRSRERRCTSW
jgi:hypothetical protein